MPQTALSRSLSGDGRHVLPADLGPAAFLAQSPLAGMLALSVLLGFPPGFYYSFAASSQALGLTVGCSLFLIATLFTVRNSASFLIPVLALFFVVAHTVVALIFGAIDFSRAALSFFLLALMFLAAIYMCSWFFRFTQENIHLTAYGMLLLLVVVAFFAVIGIQPFNPNAAKPMFPFIEPSHFALVFTPFLVYACVTSNSALKYALIAIGLGIGYYVENMSIVVGSFVAASVSIPISRIIPLAILIGISTQYVDLDYFAQRIDLSAHSENLSALVYVQGWELVTDSLHRTYGWGLGFQQLGLGPIESAAADAILRLTGDDANITDGGFMVPKLVGEFGVFGLILVLLYVFFSIRFGLKLRKIAASPQDYLRSYTLALSIFCAYSVDMFVRGVAYFSSSSFLFLCAVIYLLDRRRRIRLSTPVLPQ